MDDHLDSVNTPEEAIKLHNDIKTILSEIKMNIAKFASNSEKVMEGILPEDRAKGYEVFSESDKRTFPTLKALGVKWNTDTDQFTFHSDKAENRTWTKRAILKNYARIFDPLGFILPFIVEARIIFQDCWRDKMEWDSPLKDEKLTAWMAWIEQLPLLSNIHVDRCLKPYRNGKDVKSVQVHVFCDASTKAYATVAYLRTEFEDGETVVRFIMARGKVVPMTSQTVPRLELLAAVLGVKLSLTIKRALKLKNAQFNYWTDSLNVVCWIRSESKDLQMFVSNRTSYIQKQTDESTWRWVDTLSNPADIASRGALIDRLQGEDIWWHGPEFLPNDCNTWPKEKVYDYTPDALKEFKKSALQEQEELNQAFALLGWTPNLDPSWRYPFENISRWEDLLQRIATALSLHAQSQGLGSQTQNRNNSQEHQESQNAR